MTHLDLGTLQGPVLAFGGPYSNLQATQALIAEAGRRGLSPGNVICTGDVVAYGADAREAAQVIRAFGGPVVAGNMELQLGAGAEDCGCGFEDGTACNLMAGAWFAHASGQMTPELRSWMACCPEIITFTHEGRRVAVIHGGVTDVARFLWPCSDEADFEHEWRAAETRVGPIDLVVSGHSGVPFIHAFSFGTWVNAGVIGMPAHDGDPRTFFATLAADGPALHRLSYDHDAASDAMERAGLRQGYHRALVTGYWPSEDVLPPELTLASRAKG